MKPKTPKKYFKDVDALVAIGQKIKTIRLQEAISLKMLANECEVDYSQVSRMEKGVVNFSISYLLKVASALKVNPKKLLP